MPYEVASVIDPFSVPLSDGRVWSFAERAGVGDPGRPLILFFYPKADTPACTDEVRDFEAALPALQAAGWDVLGVSRDPAKAVARFARKHGFTLLLGADPEGLVANAFGVYVQKSMYGRTYMGFERSTWAIAPDGRILQSWRNVSVPGHVEAVQTFACS